MMRSLLVVAVLAVAAWARAQAVAPESEKPTSSLLTLIDGLSEAIEARATREKVAGGVRLAIEAARGVDRAAVDRAFAPRLRKRLKDGGHLWPVVDAPATVTVTLSHEAGTVWAIAVLDGADLPGPSVIAVSAPLDRELEVSLGASARTRQTRFSFERVGALPLGILDMVALDADGDGVDDLVTVSSDGLRVFSLSESGMQLSRARPAVPLPGKRRWPRIAVAWLASDDAGLVWGATTAGHAFSFDPREGKLLEAPQDGVPIRQPGAWNLLLASGRVGSPVLWLPLATRDGAFVNPTQVPQSVRDVVRWPGPVDAWVWVAEDGTLGGRRGTTPPTSLKSDPVGDRILVVDIDGDGEHELVTTAAVAPGEPDQLIVQRVDASFTSVSDVFKSPLAGGSVVALTTWNAVGGRHRDVLVAEELEDQVVLWRLEAAR